VRARDEFLSIASHELQTPLATLQLQLEGLLRAAQRKGDDPGGGDRTLKAVEMALKKSSHLAEMVSTLLDVSRLSEERLGLRPSDVDLGEVVREACARLEGAADEAGCRVDLRIDGELRGLWDAFRIGQVATNLVANAIKYAPGEPIVVTVGNGSGSARLVVADGGPGIAPEQQPRIFERFTRLHSARNYGGFGLGLWISREIVKAHGGTISVDSPPGKGAVFTVELPLVGTP